MSFLGGGRIIKNFDVFEDTYLPPDLPHREREVNLLLSNYVRKLLQGSTFSDISVIYGTTGRVGIGKTTLARYVGRTLEEIGRREGVKVRYVHVNVFGMPSLNAILSQVIVKLIPSFRDDVLRGYSPVELLKLLVNYVYERNMYLLIALDEFQNLLASDKITDLYMLFRIYEEIPSEGSDRVSILLVAYDHIALSLMKKKLPQVESQLNLRIKLDGYTSYELEKILEQRVELGFNDPNSIDPYLLSLIAGSIGVDRGRDGSARRAIKALYKAALYAENEGKSVIEEEDVRRALADLSPYRLTMQDLASLNLHELLILKAIADLILRTGKGWVTTDEIYGAYSNLAEEVGDRPRRKSQFHEYLNKLVAVGLIEKKPAGIAGRGRLQEIRLVGEIPSRNLIELIDYVVNNVKLRGGGRG
ncbi:Cdc6/Cdc18 family protein [Stetteria hydrogenophila]